jgi:hypothetical protein
MDHPQKYREEAERLRMEAAWVKDPDHQRMVLEMAKMYDRLADYAEKLRGGSGKP